MMKKILSFLAAAAMLVGCAAELSPVEDQVENSNYKGLVIKADCGSTKTDISEGKSTWEAGDAVTVVYDGKAYAYVASEAGAVTTLVSEAGIENYDASKEILAYYPATDVSGTVTVEAERPIEFLSEGQVNAARAPLVGVPSTGSLNGNTLSMAFRNICSVIELRIDGGGLTSPAKSLTLSIVEASGSEGYMSFTGSVNPSTLEITPSASSSSIKLVLPENTDLTKPQTIKFPVGRFTAPSGLNIELETADGNTYSRQIYKSGIKTYSLSGGTYYPMHLAKAMYAFAPAAGISSAADLIDFAAAVNAGGDISSYMSEGVVTIAEDIDLSGVEWTPIGTPKAAASLAYDSTAEIETGCNGLVIDGRDHVISNLAMAVDIQTTQVMGLFGVAKNCTIRNLKLQNPSMVVSGSGISSNNVALGLVLGVNYGSLLENVSVEKGSVSGSATSTSTRNVAIGGICGMAKTLDTASPAKFSTCLMDGVMTVDIGAKYTNTNSVVVAGVLGAVNSKSENYVLLENCTNAANLDIKTHRAAGVVGISYHTQAKGCVNSGNITAAHSANKTGTIAGVRMGGIMAYNSATSDNGSIFDNCLNTGTIATTEESSAAGGVAGLVKTMNFKDCRGAGNVICAGEMRGLLVGVVQSASKQSTFENCGVKGTIASTADMGDAVTADASNYMNLAAYFAEGVSSESYTPSNIYLIEGVVDLPKGIATGADLAAFAAAANAGDEEALSQFYDGDFIINLVADIDCSTIDYWTAIGTAERPYTGKFNGNGHVIKNLKMVGDGTETAYGLFGEVGAGAVIENFILDESCSLTVSPNDPIVCGMVAGSVTDATVLDIVNRGSVVFKDSKISVQKRSSIGGIIGQVLVVEGSSVVENLENYGQVDVTETVNTESGGNCVHASGIIAYGSGLATSPVIVKNCVNRGDLNGTCGRVSGILAGINKYCTLSGCVNYGNVFNNPNKDGQGRLGNIACNLGDGVNLDHCINYGDIVSARKCRCGGIISNSGSANASLIACENYGKVITDETGYRGTMFGYFANNCIVEECIAQGDVGSYNGGNPQMVGVTSDNYFLYVGKIKSGCTNASTSNIWWSSDSVTAGDVFSIDKTSPSFTYIGGRSDFMLSSKSWDWTVSSSEPWAYITDSEGVTVTSGSMGAMAQKMYVVVDLNPTSFTRTATVTFSSTDGTQTAVITVSQVGTVPGTRSKWSFESNVSNKYTDNWVADVHVIPATDGSSGIISAVRGEANESVPFAYAVSSAKPYVATLVQDDYLLFTLPVENVAAGTWCQFNVTVGSEANTHKYFVVEYLDGDEWKGVEKDQFSAPEDASLKYSFKVSGINNYQHASVFQLFKLQNAIPSGTIQVRLRAVGTYTCSGIAEKTTNGSANIFLPPTGFVGAGLVVLGAIEPQMTKKVLALGNSFSYVHAPSWMLQELAFSEGKALDMQGHFKGSQTLEQHLSLAMSTEAVNHGNYDFAFIQDQSENPANYAQYGTASIVNAAKTLSNNIRAKSPECQVVLENTWSFSGKAADHGGSLATFDAYLEQGTKSMAEQAGDIVSPIGQCFALCRERYPYVNLHNSDNKHQSAFGAYIKACVNYLVMFGDRFSPSASSCGLDPVTAANLRELAEEIVLGSKETFKYGVDKFPRMEGTNLRIMDNNIWDFKADTIPAAWVRLNADCRNETRAPEFAALFKSFEPDVLCLQEYAPERMGGMIATHLTEMGMASSYVSDPDISHTPIWYNTSTIELVEAGYLSYPEPWNNGGSKSYNTAVLRHKATGKNFIVLSTHLWHRTEADKSGSDRARDEQVILLMSALSELVQKYDCPVFAMGDMNCELDSPAMIRMLNGGYTPVWQVATVSGDDGGSTHFCYDSGYSRSTSGRLIDQFYISNPKDTEVKVFSRIKTDFVLPLTDHWPNYADIKL